MSFDVFISYSTKDTVAAKAACAALEAAKVRCWMAPRDIRPGAKWGASIVRAIGECRVMVLIFSGHSNSSAQVQREVDQAFGKSKTVVPLRIEDVKPADELAFYLDTVHWLDALTPPFERNLETLVGTVTALLMAPPTTVPAEATTIDDAAAAQAQDEARTEDERRLAADTATAMPDAAQHEDLQRVEAAARRNREAEAARAAAAAAEQERAAAKAAEAKRAAAKAAEEERAAAAARERRRVEETKRSPGVPAAISIAAWLFIAQALVRAARFFSVAATNTPIMLRSLSQPLFWATAIGINLIVIGVGGLVVGILLLRRVAPVRVRRIAIALCSFGLCYDIYVAVSYMIFMSRLGGVPPNWSTGLFPLLYVLIFVSALIALVRWRPAR